MNLKKRSKSDKDSIDSYKIIKDQTILNRNLLLLKIE